MSVRLSNEEIAAMEGLPHMHRCLYIFGIRQYMDYETGITGIKRGISWQSLREELYVEPHQGRIGSGSPSKDQVIRAAEFLEKIGVISNMSEGKRLIFKCVLAARDKSVQNKPATNPPRQPAIQPAMFEANIHEGFSNNPATQPAIPKSGKPATPPVSGKDNTTTNTMDGWKSFFERLGFGFQALTDGNVNGLCIYLSQEPITEAEVLKIIEDANSRAKGRITTPFYYSEKIRSFIESKKNPTPLTSGSENRGVNYANSRRDSQERYSKFIEQINADDF